MNPVIVQLTNDAIDTAQMLSDVSSELAGASMIFVGSARKLTAGIETKRLEYDCHASMAIAQMEEIAQKSIEQFELLSCHMTHRLGIVELGETSIAVALSSAHRANLFEAAPWIMDTVKKSVPIWKKEYWADGTSEWIHHGTKPESI